MATPTKARLVAPPLVPAPPLPVRPPPAHEQALAVAYGRLAALVAAATTAPHMCYMGEVVEMLTVIHTCLGALLDGLGVAVSPPEGVSDGNHVES